VKTCSSATALSAVTAGAIKMGTDSSGGFVNVAITNCSVISPRASQPINGLQRGISGLALEIVDGGCMERVAVSNLTIDGVESPSSSAWATAGTAGCLPAPSRNRPPRSARSATSRWPTSSPHAGKTGCSVVGLPGHVIENISLSNVTIAAKGAGSARGLRRRSKSVRKSIRNARCSVTCRLMGCTAGTVDGLTLTDVKLRTSAPDGRHALVLDDVREAGISGLSCSQASGAASPVRLEQSRHVLIRGCQPQVPDAPFCTLPVRTTRALPLWETTSAASSRRPSSPAGHRRPRCARAGTSSRKVRESQRFTAGRIRESIGCGRCGVLLAAIARLLRRSP